MVPVNYTFESAWTLCLQFCMSGFLLGHKFSAGLVASNANSCATTKHASIMQAATSGDYTRILKKD